jgi:hypothetical protein
MGIKTFVAVTAGVLLAGLGTIEATTVTFGPADPCVFPDASGPGAPGTCSSVITIPVSETRLIAPTGDNVTVTINGLQHPWAGDVIATLTNLTTGVSGDLFNRIGRATNDPSDFGSGAMFGFDQNFQDTYSFNSSFSGDIWADAATQGTANSIDSGNYWTTTAFSGAKTNFSSMYNGVAAAGGWQLTLSDNFADGDGGGSATNWTLTLNLTDVPEPSFAIPTGLLLLGLILIAWTRAPHRKRAS